MARALANLLRMTPESTGADVLARSTKTAQRRLHGGEAESQLPGPEARSGPVPLTRRKGEGA
jgi:hypothetical protein